MGREIHHDKTYIFYNGESLDYLHIISVKPNPTATITRQPLETGIPVADHKYRNPDSVTMSIVVEEEDWLKAKSKLIEMFEAPLWNPLTGEANSVDIYSKGAMSYSNMSLISMPHESNNNDKYNNYYFDLTFQEVIWRDAQEEDVEIKFSSQPALTSNSNVGQVSSQKVE